MARRLTDRRLAAIARDLITTDEFQKEIAKKHGIGAEYLTKIKRLPRFKDIYNRVQAICIQKGEI